MKIQGFIVQNAVSIYEPEASSIYSEHFNSQFGQLTSIIVSWENETNHNCWSFLSQTLFANRQG